MRQVRASGFLIFPEEPRRQFLLLKHRRRWDLPKGHAEEGEEPLETALRELREETGIAVDDLEIDEGFLHEERYVVYEKRFDGERCRKVVTYFLGKLTGDVDIVVTEHLGFCWFDWKPPHRMQAFTVDPLLAKVEAHLRKRQR